MLLRICLGIFLYNWSKHLHRRTRRRNIWQKFRIFLLTVLHPCRAAGGKQRHIWIYAFVQLLYKLRWFLHYRKVGACWCIIYLVKAHAMKRRDNSANVVLSVFHAKFLAHRYADCRSYLHRYPHILVIQCIPYTAYIIFNNYCTCRTYCGALSASHARRFWQRLSKRCAYSHFRATVSKIYRTYILYLIAHADAVAAQYTFVSVARYTYRWIVYFGFSRRIRKTYAVDIKTHCQILKLTLTVIVTGRTIAAVICKQQFKNIFTVFTQPFSIGFYLHTGLWRSRTGSIQRAPFIFYHAHTAGAVHR